MQAIRSDRESMSRLGRAQGRTARSGRRADSGITLIEMIIGIAIALIVVLGAGSVYLSTAKSFTLGSRKLRTQQEATLLSTVINRRVHVGTTYDIYNVPNRAVLADSGDGLAVRDLSGALLSRLEWDPTLRTLVDSLGNRVTALTLAEVKFKRNTVTPRTLGYRFVADSERGSLIRVQSAATMRN